MSWGINCIGTPEKVIEEIERVSATYTSPTDQCGIEFNAAKPHMIGLVQENFNKQGQNVVVELNASGSGSSVNGEPVDRYVTVSVKRLFTKILVALLAMFILPSYCEAGAARQARKAAKHQAQANAYAMRSQVSASVTAARYGVYSQAAGQAYAGQSCRCGDPNCICNPSNSGQRRDNGYTPRMEVPKPSE